MSVRKDKNQRYDIENRYSYEDDDRTESTDSQTRRSRTRSVRSKGRSRHSDEDSYYSEDDTYYSGESVDSMGIDNFYFSQDFLPERFDRNSQSDIPIKAIAFAQIICNIIIVYIFCTSGITYVLPFTWFSGVHFGLMCFFFIFSLFWLNYKLHNVFFSLYRLVMDLDVIKRNDKYYSGLEIPDFFVGNQEYPPITIQIPIYKENLDNTIRPTLSHCMREAERYEIETGARCNIVVCDDGYNLISDAERSERLAFYEENRLGFTARPHPSKYPRKGRFKKAGNLNFSLNYASEYLPEDEATDEENDAYMKLRDEIIELGGVFFGDIDYGEYILLIDSDTRLPTFPPDENGCLKRLAKEMMFDGDEVLFIQCFTGPYLSVKSGAEKSIFHHTCNIYNSVLMATAVHSMAPLVGHNAFLNLRAMMACAQIDENNGYKMYWAENRISEDFDMMMRGCDKGYNGRYCSHAGTFLEGVSFSYMTEYFKISKFACGAAELIYNPVTEWKTHGIISSAIIGLVRSKHVEWYNKLFMLAYTLNFVALAASHFALLYNLIFCELLLPIVPFILLPTNLLWESIFIWMILGTTVNYLFGMRFGFDPWLLMKQGLREMLFLTCLYGSITVKMSIMCFTHLFNWNMSFGATQKDDEKVTILDWIKSTPMETSVYSFYTICIFVRCYFFATPESLPYVLYYGVIPILWTIILFWAGPLIFDIIPSKKDKTTQETYHEDDKMFEDKYKTQLTESKVIQKIDVGSHIKLAPEMYYYDEDGNAYNRYSEEDDTRSHQSHRSHRSSHRSHRSSHRSRGHSKSKRYKDDDDDYYSEEENDDEDDIETTPSKHRSRSRHGSRRRSGGSHRSRRSYDDDYDYDDEDDEEGYDEGTSLTRHHNRNQVNRR